MADEKQEELSMEEILSSIRNILMEDNVSQEESKIQESKKIIEEDVVFTSETPDVLELEDELESLSLDDEVFSLSSDMLIDDFEPEINLEAELIDVHTNEEPELPIIDTDFDIKENTDKDLDILLDEIDIDALAEPKINFSEDIVEEELSTAEEPDELIQELETTDIFINEPEEEPKEQEEGGFDISLLDEILKAGNEAGTEIEKDLEEEKLDEEIDFEEHEVFLEITPSKPEEEIMEVSPVIEKKSEKNISSDASECMLNNFSRVFANENKTSSNDNSKTFEAAVAKQVQAWLDKNLASIVEDAVVEELSRVMGRTGN